MPDDAARSRLYDALNDQAELFDLDDHLAVCAACGSRVAVPYAVGAEWCCTIGCYRRQHSVPVESRTSD